MTKTEKGKVVLSGRQFSFLSRQRRRTLKASEHRWGRRQKDSVAEGDERNRDCSTLSASIN